jgi:hypothetical protein
MQMSLSLLFYVLALVLFVSAIFPIPARFNLIAAGLASAMLGFLISGGMLHG